MYKKTLVTVEHRNKSICILKHEFHSVFSTMILWCFTVYGILAVSNDPVGYGPYRMDNIIWSSQWHTCSWKDVLEEI